MLYPSYILISSFIVINACGAAIEPSTDVVSINNVNRRILNYVEEEKDRSKRSSPNFFSLVKEKVTSGIKSKISKIASSSKHFSSGSSAEHHSEPVYYDHDPNIYEHYHHPEYHSTEPFEVKSFDFWDLQKSILHTLLQAAKAIKGGLIAVKGHLIKGSGYVIAAKGKLLTAKGEAITNMGKHIASTAMLSPYPHHSIEHHPAFETEYSHGPQYESYEPSSHHHGEPQHFEALMKSPTKGVHGILVLQKIPKSHTDDLSLNGNHGSPSLQDSFVADYIQSDPKSNLKSIIRNYLLLSSHNKLNPSPIHIPGDNKFLDHYISQQSHNVDFPTIESQKESSKNFEPTPNSVDYEDFKYASNVHHNTSVNLDHIQSNNNNPNEPAYASNLKPPSTNYGVPFQLEDNFDKYHTSLLNSPTVQQTNLNLTPLGGLDTYEPLYFPDKTSHYMLQRPENFAQHPIELSNFENDLNVNKNLHSSYSQANDLLNHFNKLGNLPELDVSSSEHKQSVYSKILEQRYKNKPLNNKSVSNKSRRNRYSQNVTKRKLSPYNKTISRPARIQGLLTKF